MINKRDIKLASLNEISKFLQDKRLYEVMYDMRDKGLKTTMPGLLDLRNGIDRDFRFNTLLNITLYMNLCK